ncbi:unnamed protein product (macronuclear) [Paramecium tetraurelia]|uniref:TLDc domain-containing protein n=1 Tax=Paramecium tetraurelia TaxID=5888 RepID=A0D040_PARTE|nr:uncharacterized protein GSPATT00011959001 [Paramecium tetraurelia]CAK76407.1 unnamed protein product [Paramecium tetraurelia]|eukprot:XP_001443804.1 hypothetical protein (macronuclear) [Paramecium tetraurelia strain d4-2]
MYKIPCYKHDGSYVQFISTDKDRTEFICDQCQQDLIDTNPKFNFQNLINMSTGLKSPEFLFSKLEVSGDIKDFFGEFAKHDEISLNKQIKQFESFILDIQNGFTKMLEELQQNIKLFLDSKSVIRQNLEQIMKFHEFKSIMTNLEQLGDSINPKAIEQAETDVHQYFQNVSQECKNSLLQRIQESSVLSQQKLKNEDPVNFPEFQKLEALLKSLILTHCEFIKQLQPKPPTRYLLNDSFYNKIINQIKKKQQYEIKNAELIFQGTRDGLNANSFWKICNKKSNLLMVFKSSSQAIFGGYSPCQWICEQLITHRSDPSYSTFLFSQDKNEIYEQRLGYENGAICCRAQSGPIFGAGHDLYIDTDFADGYSKLGYTFLIPQQRMQNVWKFGNQENSTYLFGQLTPNIVECQIFEIIFQ